MGRDSITDRWQLIGADIDVKYHIRECPIYLLNLNIPFVLVPREPFQFSIT